MDIKAMYTRYISKYFMDKSKDISFSEGEEYDFRGKILVIRKRI